MTQTYALIDLANTFFRARHVASRGSDAEEKVAQALHITLASINSVVKRYGIGHVVACTEGRSFRKDLYAPYKKNRIVDAQSVTEEEQEESRLFWETYDKFLTYLKERTNVTVLRHERAEADDLIARWIHTHPADQHLIVSTDSDFFQLIAPNVRQWQGVTGELITLEGYFKESGRPVIDKKTKEPKLLEDPEYLLWKKICRGDPSDNIFSAFPGVREVGSKNKVGIKEAYEDRNKQGFLYNNFMLSRFTDHEGLEHRVRDDFERNRQLIDLKAQPQEIKDAVDQRIRESVRIETVPQVGVHFLRFCAKYNLVKLSEQSATYSSWLNNHYTGVLA